MNQKGFIGIALVIILGLAVILGGGYYAMTKMQAATQVPVTNRLPGLQTTAGAGGTGSVAPASTTDAPETACADFNSFESMIFAGLPQAAPTLDLQPEASSSLDELLNNPAYAFEWKRNANEPFITYPYLQLAALDTPWTLQPNPNLPSNPGNAAFETGAVAVSAVLQNNLTSAAQTLGFSESALNTVPYKVQNCVEYCSDGNWSSIDQRWGFTKNGSFYSVELTAQPGGQSVGDVQVAVACAVPDATFDHAYDLLLSQIPQSKLPIDNNPPVINDALYIWEMAKDLSAVEVGLGDFYSLTNNKAVLVSKGGPICQALERHQVGLGMKCIDAQTGAQRTVVYGNPEPASMTYTDSAFGYQFQYPAGFTFSVSSLPEAYAAANGPDVEIIRDDGLSPYADDGFEVWVFNQGDPRIPTDVPDTSINTQAGQWMHASVKLASGTAYDRYWTTHDGRVYMIQFTSADPAFKTIFESVTFTS